MPSEAPLTLPSPPRGEEISPFIRSYRVRRAHQMVNGDRVLIAFLSPWGRGQGEGCRWFVFIVTTQHETSSSVLPFVSIPSTATTDAARTKQNAPKPKTPICPVIGKS